MQLKNILILLAFLSLLPVIEAQNPSIPASLKTYNETVYQEKIFLHTDKSFYLTGEEIYFKAYLVNAVDHQPSDLSKVIYVELLSKDSAHVQTKISPQDGGNGSLFLPTDLKTGKYIIRAYTRWMMNFDADFYFQKTITVFNPFQPVPQPKPTTKHYDVQFFPEGGHWVESLRSKIGFRVVDENGKGVDCNGFILSDKNDTLVRFRSLKFGLGHFYLTPEKGESYYALLFYPSGEMITKKSLPSAEPKGYS
ncbi:MAG: hypothetical protein KDD63_21985, partial [Bacteroidetes bacterium]|nr:hypothetical protein [Bacteroidota bacterium]